MLHRYPFISLNAAFVIARIMTALFFMAHAGTRIFSGTIPQFGKAMESFGLPYGEVCVWAISIAELTCGTLLILDRWARWATIPLATIVIGGIVLIHAKLGWFVGEFGTGGMEYSFALLVLLLLIAAQDSEKTTRR